MYSGYHLKRLNFIKPSQLTGLKWEAQLALMFPVSYLLPVCLLAFQQLQETMLIHLHSSRVNHSMEHVQLFHNCKDSHLALLSKTYLKEFARLAQMDFMKSASMHVFLSRG